MGDGQTQQFGMAHRQPRAAGGAQAAFTLADGIAGSAKAGHRDPLVIARRLQGFAAEVESAQAGQGTSLEWWLPDCSIPFPHPENDR
ncbi:hypothetical protein Acid7E03_16800 [Acidisoma sp. 7E03]